MHVVHRVSCIYKKKPITYIKKEKEKREIGGKKERKKNQAWWCTALIPTLRRQM